MEDDEYSDDYDPYTNSSETTTREPIKPIEKKRYTSIKDLTKIHSLVDDVQNAKRPPVIDKENPPTHIHTQTPSAIRRKEQYKSPENYAQIGCPFCVHLMK